RKLFLSCFIAAAAASLSAQPASNASRKLPPTVDQILSLKHAGTPEISPDGRWVAYTIRETTWDENAYETEIWLADVQAGASRQLTNAKKSSQSPAWSPDGSKLAFLSDRTDKQQIYLINPQGGEAEAITSLEDGVGRFAWSSDGKRLAYTATDPKSAAVKDREKKYGEFQIVDQDQRMTRLFVIDLATRIARALTPDAFTVGSFAWSPDALRIAFDHRVNNSPASSGSADISIVTVADASLRKLVTQDGPDTNPTWSPDGSQIAFTTSMANPNYYYTNTVIATVPAGGGTPTVVTASFDENPSIVAWKPAALFFSASQRTWAYLYGVDPASRTVARLAPTDASVMSSVSVSKDGSTVAFLAADPKTVPEVYVANVGTAPGSARGRPGLQSVKKLTSVNEQTGAWATSALEVVSWKSQ